MRLLLTALLTLTLVGCGGGDETKLVTTNVVGTVEISVIKAAGAQCVLLRSSDQTFHLAPGAYTLLPVAARHGVQKKVVRASRLSAHGSSSALLRHGTEVSVTGQVSKAPEADPCGAEQILSVEKLKTSAAS